MDHSHAVGQPDFGTGQKKLGIYTLGIVLCSLLTLLSFWAVMKGDLTRPMTFTIIYASACVQFLIQIICFLRLNTQTEQGRSNVLSFVFALVILVCIVLGSFWIIANLSANLMH